MTDLDLDAIRAREQAATPGPWSHPFPRKNRITTAAYIDVTEADWGGEGLREYSLGCTEDRNAWRAEDAEFIAHARADIPALIAAVQRRDDALAAVLALCDRYEHADERFNPPTGQQVAAKVHNAITAHLAPDVPMSPNKGHADNPTTEEDR